MKKQILFAGLGLVLLTGILTFAFTRKPPAAPQTLRARLQQVIQNPQAKPDGDTLLEAMRENLAGYRKIIVLFADEKTLSPEEREQVNRIGFAIYYENQGRSSLLDEALGVLATSSHKGRVATMEDLLDWVESGNGLYDADRLAFKESLRALQRALAADQSLPAVKLHKRISEDLSALAEIEAMYDKELRQVFGRFGDRGIEIQRQKWDDYVAKLKGFFTRERILRDYGTIIPYARKTDEDKEITGKGLPPKTLVLTFDDGPHGTYTEEIAAILKQYGVPGLFFELGQNLGSCNPDGTAKLGRLAATSRKLLEGGNLLGNHSFSHGNLSLQSEATLKVEISQTDALLKAIDGGKSRLFRFPYGARTESSLATLDAFHLKSMLWNIDSRDWADPVPGSIVDRVLRSIEAEQRGIVLFHDINERTVKALPTILDRLLAEGYRFAAWDGQEFKIGDATITAGARAIPTTGYRESWAVVIGIDEYAKWPRLQYAGRDAEAMKQALVEKFGFPEDHVLMLKNKDATRANILGILNGKLGQGNLQRDDRVMVFFAGHGTTRKLSSGRDLGYLVPVDSDPQNVAADAIPMTELQNIAEAIPAKHVLFLMDSCYSGLGLVRGGASQNFLRENAKRIGRQMLTAGGADQMVSDGGPGGHSIFTWTLLQGLAGKADLNGDGFITATELAAYLSPAVSSVSAQTPAFGSLPGSEGGEFVFELPAETEFLNPETRQMEGPALALNQKIEAKLDELKPKEAVKVKTLEGGEAKVAAGKAVAVPPRQAAQHANDRGLLRFKEKRYAEAEAEFTEALKQRPDFALAANNLGFVYFKQDRFPEAARWFENAIRMDPSRAIAYCNLGDALLKTGEKDKARKAFDTYLELAPKGPNAAHVREALRQF
jgi:peptidoglycan/xylan/chitin deacetylase (PgdA/CDA1 family)/uncharacterized caspase-like protein